MSMDQATIAVGNPIVPSSTPDTALEVAVLGKCSSTLTKAGFRKSKRLKSSPLLYSDLGESTSILARSA